MKICFDHYGWLKYISFEAYQSSTDAYYVGTVFKDDEAITYPSIWTILHTDHLDIVEVDSELRFTVIP